ncbi:MAG TPA: aspartate--ammonia ligase [Candidatus Paceibacterota bacterium]|nr:aspartate--ammonia ligase [Verrucomicrobiota bacterium]HRY50050.1 aspartate--ammonia ligase [Candidatus Paceibacterota bacterium]HSA03328.1 aspartate--ammonia ligase [Candidatus Paceibacterota bacterium]
MNNTLILPAGYQPLLGIQETERAIKALKDFVELNLATELNLSRVTAPLFVKSGTGINDDLNGIERPVGFPVKDLKGERAEIVHSLAKWKRLMLEQLGFEPGYGLYTDMNAIRADEQLDNTHSLYVDQWDWERVIRPEERNLAFLKKIVCKIYSILKRTEHFVYERYPNIRPELPEEITFVHTEELLARYPTLTPKEREQACLRECGAAFIVGIGGALPNGEIHDGRAPDYDDWTTPTVNGYHGLNGDIFVWNPVLNMAFELSSMGIRVDPATLRRQLEIRNCTDREQLYFHRRLLNHELPLSLGGGIGQSRLCMYYLRKAHIGEIQASLWPDEMIAVCRQHRIALL